MRIKQTALYKFDELSDEAKQRARAWYREEVLPYNTFAIDEMVDSLKAVFAAAGIKLTDWSLGAYSYCSVRFDMGDAGALTGKRAFAWLENHLFGPLRITRKTFSAKRKEFMGYGSDYRIGEVPPGPLTGMSYDEDFLDSLKKDVRDGENLREAFVNLAGVFKRIAEADEEYRSSDGVVDEDILANECEFKEDGQPE